MSPSIEQIKNALGRKEWNGISGVVAIVGVLVAIIGVVVAIIAIPAAPSATPSTTATPGTPRNTAALPDGGPAVSGTVVLTAVVTELDDKRAVDLDTGAVEPSNDLPGQSEATSGQDISPAGRASGFGLMAKGVMFAVLPEAGREDFRRCVDVPEAGWLGRPNLITGLHQMAPGRNICIRTSAANVAMVTIDRTPNNATGTIDFHYVVWRR